MMDQQSSEPTSLSTDVHNSHGSVVIKQELYNDSAQMDVTDDCGLSDNVINIAPIIGNQSELSKMGNIHSLKKDPHENWCELSENYQPAIKLETVKHETVKHETVKHETVKHETVKHETVKHETVKHETVKHETVKHETVKLETVKSENDLNVCDCNQDSKLTNRMVSLKTECIQTNDSSSQLVEVSGTIDCKDDIISNVTAGIGSGVGRVNQSDEEQSDASEQQPPCYLKSTDEIKREGM